MSRLKEMEYKVILETLKETNYNLSESARILGVALNTLKQKMRDNGIKIKVKKELVIEKKK
jgi:DNA-binding NtrC family response regulator